MADKPAIVNFGHMTLSGVAIGDGATIINNFTDNDDDDDE